MSESSWPAAEDDAPQLRLEPRPRNRVVVSDAFELLATLPDDSVDLLVTDPPYESLQLHRSRGTTTRLTTNWFTTVPNARLPELLATHRAQITEKTGQPPGVLSELGVVPSYYLRYFYCHDAVVAEQRQHATRAEEVSRLERELLAMYADPAVDRKPALLERRGGAYYSEAAVALLASLVTDGRDTQEPADQEHVAAGHHHDARLPQLGSGPVLQHLPGQQRQVFIQGDHIVAGHRQALPHRPRLPLALSCLDSNMLVSPCPGPPAAVCRRFGRSHESNSINVARRE